MINLHGHTVRCGHASGADRDFVEAAIAAGYKEIGFSDHAYMGSGYSAGIFAPDEKMVRDYVNSVNALRDEYADRITIHLGFETEYVDGLFDQALEFFKDNGIEYLLLGQHFTKSPDGKSAYAGAANTSCESFEHYIDDCLKGMATGKFTYLAHPDLFKFVGDRDFYKEKMAYMVTELKKLNVQIEYNRLGVFDHRNYPDPDFWALASAAKMDTCIGLDAHQPEVYTDKDTVVKIEGQLAALGLKHRDPDIVYI